MLLETKNLMNEYADTLTASSIRAQCYIIANLTLGSATIAEALLKNHKSLSDAKRAAMLMVNAGCAEEICNKNKHLYSNFIFEDGSSF